MHSSLWNTVVACALIINIVYYTVRLDIAESRNMLLECLAIFVVLLLLLYRWSIDNYNFFSEQGIDYEKPYPLVGSLWKLYLHRKTFFDLTIEMYNKSSRK